MEHKMMMKKFYLISKILKQVLTRTSYSRFVLSFLFLLSSPSFSKEMIYVGTEKIPNEFNQLLKSLQTDFKTPSSANLYLENLSSCFEQINDKSIQDVIKKTMYKALLGRFNHFKALKLPDEKELETLKDSVQKKKAYLEFFPLWILEQVESDIKKISLNPQYKTLILRLHSKNQLFSRDLSFLKRRAELVMPWYEFFANYGFQEIMIELRPLAFKILERIQNICTNLLSFSKLSSSKKEDKKISEKFFTLIDIGSERNKELLVLDELPKPIDDIKFEILVLEKNEEHRTSEGLPDPINDWNF